MVSVDVSKCGGWRPFLQSSASMQSWAGLNAKFPPGYTLSPGGDPQGRGQGR